MRASLVLGLILLATTTPAARAAPPVAATLTAQDQADLHQVEAYLEGLHTLKAQFEQTNQDGSVASGQVFLSRPGRMRFEYAPPIQLMIVSDGSYVAVDDKELKEVQFYPVDATPVWFLLREGIRLSGDVTVTKLVHVAGTLRISCTETKDFSAGQITLIFSDGPLSLRQWTILDAQGHETTLALENPETGVSIDPALFVLPASPKSQAAPGRVR